MELTGETRSELAERAAQRHDWIGRAGRPDRATTSGPYRRTADFRVSTTDPDATPMPHGERGTRLGYQDHYVVDGGRARIILTALVAPAEVQENQPALDLLWRARFRWKLRPRQVTGDTKYGTVENIAAIEAQGIRAYFPLSAAGRRRGLFTTTDFVYDVATDTYHCPGEQRLRFLSQCETTRRRVYEAPAGACVACAFRPQCTTSQRGRRVGRSLEETLLERVRGYHDTEPYAKAMRKRKVWVEPLFAEAKDWHGLRRFRLRGLEKVNGEALLIAAGQNLKRLLSRWGWGRRPFPSGAAGIALPAHPRSCRACCHDCGAAVRPAPLRSSHHVPFSTRWTVCETVVTGPISAQVYAGTAVAQLVLKSTFWYLRSSLGFETMGIWILAMPGSRPGNRRSTCNSMRSRGPAAARSIPGDRQWREGRPPGLG